MDFEALKSELLYKFVRSSGSGGQHVNKVSTKVELQFDLSASEVLTEVQKLKLKDKLSGRFNKQGILVLTCGETRSQLKNKTLVTKRFIAIIKEGLKEKKKRKPTTIPGAVKKKRLEDKRKHALKKAQRRPPDSF